MNIGISEHPCYRCLVKACCSKWCSIFYNGLFDIQKKYGVIDDDTLIDFIIKYSRSESWKTKE